MMYSAKASFSHDDPAAIGVLLTNLGTPDAPTPAALRRYLREFLSDPRVVEQPRWLWWLILNGIILNVRPKRSAAAYRTVWGEEGSPLLATSRQQQQALAPLLQQMAGTVPLHVELAMRYGNPGIRQGLEALRDKGCRKILVLPLYPQYSATTTGSTFDAVADVLKTWRWVPELRMVEGYHAHPAYIEALAASVRAHWQQHGEPERLLLSFHGIPQRYFEAGDPYPCLCRKTGRLLAEALNLPEGRWQVCFQSRFGREPWMQPYTDETLKAWGAERLARVDVICPGFSADCLETLEEIAVENRHIFEQAGGGAFHYIPALNTQLAHIDALYKVAADHLCGWLPGKSRAAG